jgi:xanthine/uracil permease
MDQAQFLYGLDQRPPLWKTLIYGFQWALLTFPILIVIASIAAHAVSLSSEGKVVFFQRILLLSGIFTMLQTVIGHRYPLQEGPAAALLLTYVNLAPHGIATIQGGFFCGGLFLFVMSRLRWMKYLVVYFTPNVVGVILILVTLTIIPYLVPLIIGIDQVHPQGNGMIFAMAISIILLITFLLQWFKGFWHSCALILGMIIGTVGFLFTGHMDLGVFSHAHWFALPESLWAGIPHLSPPAMAASMLSYLAVIVNSVGSIQGMAEVVGKAGLAERVNKGIGMTGLAGMAAAAMGVVGTVSYSTGPGVVLTTRIASRLAQTMGGAILVAAAFIPRLSALLAAVPSSVIGAGMCVALASQIVAGMAIIANSKDTLAGRDYLVVGLPLLMGTLVSGIPSSFFAGLPSPAAMILSNGLVLGILLVLILEHGLKHVH